MSFSWYYNMFELKCTLELRHLYFNLAAFHFLTTFNVIYALFTQKDVGIEESHIYCKRPIIGLTNIFTHRLFTLFYFIGYLKSAHN